MMQRKERRSNFELLRLLAISVIVIGHLCGQSAIAGTSVEANRIVALLLGGGGRIAVNVFLLLGAWFMVDSRFRPERIVRLYLQVALYSIPLTAVLLIMGCAGGARNVLQGFLPFLGRPLWFATAYISLVALSPYLNLVFRLDDRGLSRLAVALVLVFSLTATVPSYTAPEYLADFAWFPVVYILVGWAKRVRAFDLLPGKWVSLFLGIGVGGVLLVARLQPSSAWVASYWLVHLQSLPNILSAVLIFNAFRLFDIGVVRGINWMASSVFSVYIVHQVPAFIACEWDVIFCAGALKDMAPVWFAAFVATVPIALVVILAIADRLYMRPAEKAIERTPAFGFVLRILRWMYPSEG